MLRQIPMYLVLAAQLALLMLCWLRPGWPDPDWELVICAPAQVVTLAGWLVLGRTSFWVRLLFNAAILSSWAAVIAHHNPVATMVAAYLSLLVICVVGVTGVMRVSGWRIEELENADLDLPTKRVSQRPHFSLRHVAVVVSTLSVLFAINARWHLTTQLSQNSVLPGLGVLTAIMSMLALWATLGVGRLANRLPVYAFAAFIGINSLTVTNSMTFGYPATILMYLLPDVAIVPLTLLAFRIAGYRVMRQVSGSTSGEAAVTVVSP